MRPFPQFPVGDKDLTNPLGLITAITAWTLAEDAEKPHVVVSYDPQTNRWEAWGPYNTGHEALIEAEKMAKAFNTPESNDGVDVLYWPVILSGR